MLHFKSNAFKFISNASKRPQTPIPIRQDYGIEVTVPVNYRDLIFNLYSKEGFLFHTRGERLNSR